MSRETLQSILAALGHEADSDERAAESLAALDRRAWQAVLPAVTVVRESEVTVELSLPKATRVVSWHLLCEDGAERTGDAAFAGVAAPRARRRRRLAARAAAKSAAGWSSAIFRSGITA